MKKIKVFMLLLAIFTISMGISVFAGENRASLSVAAKTNNSAAAQGDRVIISAAAQGGSGTYTYSYLIHNIDTNEWFRLTPNFSSNANYSWTAGKAGNREFFVEVKDSTGKIVRSSAVKVKVGNKPLSIMAKANLSTAAKGEKVTISGTAQGGSGSYTYSYLIHNTDTNEWFRLTSSFTNSNSYTWTAGAAGNREFFVEAKDKSGKIVRSNAVKVKVNDKPLTIIGKVSKNVVKKGEKVEISGTAQGGSGSYTYSYLIHNTDINEWFRFTPNFVSNSSYTWTAGAAGNREFFVEAKDKSGKIVRSDAIKIKVNPASEIIYTAVTDLDIKFFKNSISFNNHTLSARVGDDTTLLAEISPENATNKHVIWSSSNPDIVSIDNMGRVTMKAVGQAVITAKAEDGGKTASLTFKVTPAIIPVTGVSISNKKELALDFNDVSNKTYQCNVSVTPSNATNKIVSWSSSDPKVATVDSNGKITAIARGIAVITAKTSDGAKTDTIKVYVYKTNAVILNDWKGADRYLKLRLASKQNLVLDVYDGKTYNGAKVQLWGSNESSAQFWQFHDYSSAHGGIAIVPKCNNGSYILDVNRGGNNYTDPFQENNAIDLWSLGADDAASMWELVRLWDDTYIIRLKNTWWSVGATSVVEGAGLGLRKLDVFDLNQRWVIDPVTITNSDNTDSLADKLNRLRNVSPYRDGDTWDGCFSNAWQCHGWALMTGNEISGTDPRNWSVSYTLEGVKTGDIIRYGGNVGHTIVVVSVSGDVITYVDCNGNGGANTVKWDSKISKSAQSIFGYSFSYRMVAP